VPADALAAATWQSFSQVFSVRGSEDGTLAGSGVEPRTAETVPSRRRGTWWFGASVVFGLALLGGVFLWPPPPDPAPTEQPDEQPVEVVAEAEPQPTPPPEIIAEPTPEPPTEPPTEPQVEEEEPAPEPVVAEGPAPGTLSVRTVPWSEIYVDGTLVKSDIMLRRHEVAGGAHEVRLVCTSLGGKEKVFTVNVDGTDVSLGCWDFDKDDTCRR